MTLIVPHTDSLEIVKFNMPKQANQFYVGLNPQEWSISNTVFEPVSQPESNFYSIAPRLSPTAQDVYKRQVYDYTSIIQTFSCVIF